MQGMVLLTLEGLVLVPTVAAAMQGVCVGLLQCMLAVEVVLRLLHVQSLSDSGTALPCRLMLASSWLVQHTASCSRVWLTSNMRLRRSSFSSFKGSTGFEPASSLAWCTAGCPGLLQACAPLLGCAACRWHHSSSS